MGRRKGIHRGEIVEVKAQRLRRADAQGTQSGHRRPNLRAVGEGQGCH